METGFMGSFPLTALFLSLSECAEVLSHGPALKAFVLGFWLVPSFWGEMATLLRKLGLCFLSRSISFQVMCGP